MAAAIMATIVTATATTTLNPTATPTRTPQINATPTINLTTPPPQTEWSRTYGGTGDDIAYSVQQTSDGGYIAAGYTDSLGLGSRDFWLVKIQGGGAGEGLPLFVIMGGVAAVAVVLAISIIVLKKRKA
ncbi:MAG: hypothetical protein WED04_08575 [Promethearchaeati archaeon SRVP18_Atabeyarchaeia-1]